jgi:hydroxymethylpyrimidine/phosphomethylpyrimidine kinase
MPLVVDPVMIATSGGRLLDEDAVETLTESLFPLARLITPNLDEAAALLGNRIQSRQQMADAAVRLWGRFGCAVLLKGGHLAGEDAPDVLVDQEGVRWFENRRIHGVHTHGTGCTLSAAIATGLAKALPLREAVRVGKAFVAQAIARHYRWEDVDALNHQHASAEFDSSTPVADAPTLK